MANKWLKQLKSYDDAVDYEYDSFAPENCLYTPSPYFNWIFSNKANGVPKNASVLFFSEPKAGKSLSCYAMILEMQRRDPEGIAIYFNTELRGQLQHGVFDGIDKDRLIIYDTNNPVDIFDRCESDISALCQDGMPLRMIVVDSLTNIQGIKRAAADSVSNHLIGDQALTLQIGLGKLVPFCKRNNILLVATSQMRANMDAGSYGPKEKAQASLGVRHSFEYFISVKRAGAAEDKKDLEGHAFVDDDIKDARGEKLLLAHKIYVKCEASSIGQAGRAGVFTMDYKNGIINQHEEIFMLGKSTGVIKLEGQTYSFGKYSVRGQAAFANLIKENPELASEITKAVISLDSDK